MLSSYCSFKTSKLLAKRSFLNYFTGLGMDVDQWYDVKGNITDVPTNYPCVRYEYIYMWLEEYNIYAVALRIHDTDFFCGKVYVPSGQTNEKGKPLCRLRGRESIATCYEDAFVAATNRAILAVPLDKYEPEPYDPTDDLPF